MINEATNGVIIVFASLFGFARVIAIAAILLTSVWSETANRMGTGKRRDTWGSLRVYKRFARLEVVPEKWQ